MSRVLAMIFSVPLLFLMLWKFSVVVGGSNRVGDRICKYNSAVNTNCHFEEGSPEPAFPEDGKLRMYSMRFCPYSHRVHLVLNAKNISYNIAYINLSKRPKWYYSVNPKGQTPTLNLVNEPKKPFLVDSLVVAEYLDEKYPQVKLYPTNPLEKAQTKLLISRFGTLDSAFHRLVYKKNEKSVDEEMLNTVYTELEFYENELKKRGTNYFGGAAPGILDYALWPWFERMGVIKSIVGDKYNFDERFPTLSQWVQLTKEDSAVQKHYLPTETHTKYTFTVRDGNTNYNILMDEQ